MSMTDPIADFLTRIRNGIQAAHQTVDIPSSKLKVELARILREQGYIQAYELRDGVPGDASEKIVVTWSMVALLSGLVGSAGISTPRVSFMSMMIGV